MDIQTWHVFALATVITGSISSLYVRVMMKHDENDPILFMMVFQFTLSAIVLMFAFTRGFVFPPLTDMWPQFLLSAVLYAVGSLSNFFASKYIEAGEMTILTSSGAVVTIILGVTLLGNPFGWGKALGTVLVLSSVFIPLWKRKAENE